MDKKFENAQSECGNTYTPVADDPYGGILQDEHLRRNVPADSFDDFWLRIRNR